jgi:serine protease Do
MGSPGSKKRASRLRSSVLVLGLVLMTGCASALTAASDRAPAVTSSPSTGSGTAKPLSNSTYVASSDPVVETVKAASPAVVNVTTKVRTFDPFSGSGTTTGVGTGFIVRSNGVILTNDHVVEGATGITVTLRSGKRHLAASVVAEDATHDLAVLKVAATGLPTVAVGSSSGVQLGQRVVAIGYALALHGGPTVTSGIVSSLHRTIQVQDPNAQSLGGVGTYRNVFQTDAAINPGNSGGPLLNLQGQVVAIDSAGSQSAQNIGFAIPIDSAKPLLSRAIAQVAA